MNTYLFSIESAIITFPLIAFLLSLPYMIYQYHKYGSIPWLRTLVVYSFLLYIINMYCLAILPLPNPEEVAKLTTPRYQLLPFYFIIDLVRHANTTLQGTTLAFAIVKDPEFYTTILNVLMFVPFGIYMRYYFKLSLKKTILFSFLFSLFIETTQLSGLYFIYPRPYRLFDVDDLIINTLGGLIGYTIAPIITFLLPSRDTIDNTSIQHAGKVTTFRRLSAIIIDYIILQILLILLQLLFHISTNNIYHFIYFIYFFLSTLLTNGHTIGKRAVKIKIVGIRPPINKKAYIFRYALLYLIIFQAFPIGIQILMFLLSSPQSIILKIIFYSIVVICFTINIIFFIEILISLFKRNYHFFYEKLSNTKNTSTFY